MDCDVVIEIPRGCRNKYEMDHRTGRIRLDRQLLTATAYPADYGFIDDTLSEDGDPLDVLVLLDEGTFPGCVIESRIIGALDTRDEKGPDPKILAVPTSDVRIPWNDIHEVPDFRLSEIRHFFEIYKDLEPNKLTTIGEWLDATNAARLVTEARSRYDDRAPA
jgi:inorganic pyrophosphatase